MENNGSEDSDGSIIETNNFDNSRQVLRTQEP